MYPATPHSDTDEIAAARALLREVLARPTTTPQRVLRWLTNSAVVADLYQSYARQADRLAADEPEGSQASRGWRIKAAGHRRDAAVETAKTELLREHMGGLPPRSHQHAFTEKLSPEDLRCRCGQSEVAAETLDPDYVTACCGCPIGKRREPVEATTLEFCFACQQQRVPLIHLDQWPSPRLP
ncbi:hypothetical protein [Nocardia asiatica]|uniref:hypothetical protein n=1 Tax=Nocardia asiatica TaxID=209252 RepID=UPI0024552A76|nr:hypothetical protein [Nocardia asiatica]